MTGTRATHRPRIANDRILFWKEKTSTALCVRFRCHTVSARIRGKGEKMAIEVLIRRKFVEKIAEDLAPLLVKLRSLARSRPG